MTSPLLHRRRGLPQRDVRKMEQSEETAQALRAGRGRARPGIGFSRADERDQPVSRTAQRLPAGNRHAAINHPLKRRPYGANDIRR